MLPRLALSLATAILLPALFAPAQAQELYRWKDEKGVVHYADKKPEGVDAERREYKAQDLPTSKTPGSANVPAEESAAAAKPDPAVAARACEQARENLRVLMVSPQVSMDTDGDGTPEVLDEDAKQQMISRYQASVDRLCAEPPADDA